MFKKKKAIALYSGGLDSILAIKLILEQGIEVIGVHLKTPFIDNCQNDYGQKYLGIPLIEKDISKDFHQILMKPQHGYGKNLNPCIDCRILMFRKAGEMLEQKKALFIISGEVLGQRPMTQNKNTLLMIGNESGYGNLIVRPLSALLLPETEPEKRKLISRSQLMDIQGRSRKRQISLAEKWHINQYPSPAGGCKLTEPGFAKRMNDLLAKEKFTQNDIELLKIGRHFSINKKVKLIVGRNEIENKKILSIAHSSDYLFASQNYKGPLSLLRFYGSIENKIQEIDRIMDLASRITARYCDREKSTDFVDINIWQPGQKVKQTKYVPSLSDQKINDFRL